MPRIKEDELDNTLDLPVKESMRGSASQAERRNMSTDDKKSNHRAQKKQALSLTPSTSTAYTTPGYYVTDRYGAPQDGPYATYSLAIANLNGRDAIQFMDQPVTQPINEPFPPQLFTVNGSKKQTAAESPKGGWGHTPWPAREGEKKSMLFFKRAAGDSDYAEHHSYDSDSYDTPDMPHAFDSGHSIGGGWGGADPDAKCKYCGRGPTAAQHMYKGAALSDQRISDAYERHIQWAKENGYPNSDSVEALRAHEKARGITRAEADGIADQQYIGGGDTNWRSQKHRDASLHREAELLDAMARNPHQAAALMTELEALRREQRMEHEASREIDLANAIISDVRTPVATYSHHTAATDWLGEEGDVTPSEVTNRIITSASLWYANLNPAVRNDPEEFKIQAEGYFRREASQYGPMASEAYGLAMTHLQSIDRINRKANQEGLLPWSAVLPPLPPSMPVGVDMNTNHVPGPGNPGQPMPWSNDAEHAAMDASPSTPEAMAQAGQVNYFYPNQDATPEPNDDGMLQAGNGRKQAAGYATGPYSTPITDPSPWSTEPAPLVTQDQPHTDPAQLAQASGPGNEGFWPNQDATNEPNPSGFGNYGRTAGRRTASDMFTQPRTTYQEYLGRISEGATPVPQEFWSGMAASVSPSMSRESVRREAVFHEMYGEVTRPQLAAYRKHNVSPADHDEMVSHFGDNAKAIIDHIKRNSPNGMYQPRWGWQRDAQLHEAARPRCELCGQYGHSEEAHDEDPLYANWTDTRPWGRATREDNVWGYPGEGNDIGRPRIAAKNDKPAGDDGEGVDRSLYAQSPGGHQNQDNQSYSSDRHVNWTDMPQGPPEVSDHAAGGVPTSFLGTVPVQGYGQDAEHPSGEMWPWQDNAPGSGAAAVWGTPTPGEISLEETGASYPQPY